MVTNVLTGMVQGVEGVLVKVEADVSQGLPMINLFGSISAEVREGKERVRTAMKNIGIHLPPSRITINLAPGDIRKSGTSFDLAIAVALFLVMKLIPLHVTDGILFLGELSLDGTLSAVHGVLPVLKSARNDGCSRCFVPFGNLEEASLLEGMQAVGFSNLREVYDYLKQDRYHAGKEAGTIHISPDQIKKMHCIPDLSEVRGQALSKRALEIAVAGFHNVLLDGPPGVGKSLLASCVPGIMPEMTMEEKIETTMIYSVKGLLGNSFFLVESRPFRAPSHNVTMMGMFGGGMEPEPGEISLAHHGVLFLDEFPEYKRDMLEMLRVPLEAHKIVLIRNNRSIEFPADFILIAASNPCPCGFYPDRSRCRCSVREIRKYQNKISGPMRDRIDLFVRCEEVEYAVLTSDDRQESSKIIRNRVIKAWERQRMRSDTASYHFNGRMNSGEIRRYCHLTEEGSRMMASSFRHFQMSARAYYRILKVARTIADLQGEEAISTSHLEEALIFRNAAALQKN